MTNESKDRIRAALTILGTSASEREVSLSLRFIDRAKRKRFIGVPQNKKHKAAMAKFIVALHRLKGAIKSPDLDEYILSEFPVDGKDCDKWIDYAIPAVDHRLARPHRGDSESKRQAAKFAARLLSKHGHPVTATRGGKWCKLSRVLHGGKPGDFFEVCRAMKDRI